MSRTIRRKNVTQCYHWEHKHYFKMWIKDGKYRWDGNWVPIDKEKEPKLWKKHWWKAHADNGKSYVFTELYPKYESGRLRVESRRQLYHAMNDVEYDITVETLYKQTFWDPWY